MRAQVKMAAPAGMLAGIVVGVSEAARAAAADRALTGAGEFWGAWAITVGIYAALGLAVFTLLGLFVGLIWARLPWGAPSASADDEVPLRRTKASRGRREELARSTEPALSLSKGPRAQVLYLAAAAAVAPAAIMLGQADLSAPGLLLPEAVGISAFAAGLAAGAAWVVRRRVRLDGGDAAAFAAGCLVGGALWARWNGPSTALRTGGVGAVTLGLVVAAALDALWRVWALPVRRGLSPRGLSPGEGTVPRDSPRAAKWLWWLVAAEPVVVILLGAIAVARVAYPSPPRGAPNVLLITVDALRADRLGAYGSHRGLTPNLDRFARDAVVFENAFTAAPWTTASIGALLVSRYPSELGLFARERSAQEAVIRGGLLTAQPTLAELLRAKGYVTAAEVPNPQLRRIRGVQRGFLVFRNPYDFQGEKLPSLPRLGKYEGWFMHTSVGLRLAQALYRRPRYYRAPGVGLDDARRVVRDASRGLSPRGLSPGAGVGARHALPVHPGKARTVPGQRRPFLLWMHLMDTHVPYRARRKGTVPPWTVPSARVVGAVREPPVHPAESRAYSPPPSAEFFKGLVWQQTSLTEPQKRYIAALYDDNVRYADEWIGRLCGRLRKLSLYQNTLIIVTADHGEEFWDHGGFEHGRTLYDEVLRVPLLIKFPRGWRAGERCPSLAGLIDLLPTVMDVVGPPLPRGPSASSGQAVRGESLVRLVRRAGRARTRPDRRELFSEFTLYGDELKGLRTARYKVIFHRARGPRGLSPAQGTVPREFEVYDLRADPQERHNLAGGAPPAGDARVAAAQRRRLLEFARASERRGALWARVGGKEAPLDERTRESLRSIGYVAR